MHTVVVTGSTIHTDFNVWNKGLNLAIDWQSKTISSTMLLLFETVELIQQGNMTG